MDWLAPHFTVDQIAAEDRCLEEVRKHLAADATLRGIFEGGSKIYALAFMPPDIQPNSLVVTPLTADETPQAGSRSTLFSLYVVCRFRYPRTLQLAQGKAGLATLFRHICTVLSAPGARSLSVQRGGQTVPLVRSFEPKSMSFQPVPVEPGATSAIFDASLRFELDALLDPTTRQIWNLAVNG